MKKLSRGFTAIEVTIALTLTVVVASGILGVGYILGNVQERTFLSFGNVEKARYAVRQISRELRTARSGDNGAFLLANASGDSISFYSDIDFDGATEYVTYSRVGTTLTKQVTRRFGYPYTYPPAQAVTTTIATTVRNGSVPVFTYFDENWPTDTTNNPLTTPANVSRVKMVRVYLRMNESTTNPSADYILDTMVNLRMVKTNL